MRAIVLTSPERMNAIRINVKKNISAVPKSFIRKRLPTQVIEKIMYFVRLVLESSFSSDTAPTSTKAIFTSSEGWIEKKPRSIQLSVPFVTLARARLAASTPSEPIAAG